MLSDFFNLNYTQPLWFFSFPIIWTVFLLKIIRKEKNGVRFSSLVLFKHQNLRISQVWIYLPDILRCLALSCFVFALARPSPKNEISPKSGEGLEIMIAVDTSGSMRAQDYIDNGKRMTRLDAVKNVISKFVLDRPNDRIGLVVFGTESFTQAPLTLDHQIFNELLNRVEIGVAGEATAIGDAIVVALNRLKRRQSDPSVKGKIIVLMTDGASNAGKVDPITAARTAQGLGIRVYTIGVGTSGDAPIVVNGEIHYIQADIDEKTMQEISSITQGQYFKAEDLTSLFNVYATIDRLEKSKFKEIPTARREEKFAQFIYLGLVFLLGELIFGWTKWRLIPS